MNAPGLQLLRDEMLEDCRVALEALRKAHECFHRKEEMAYEAYAHQFCRAIRD